MIIWVLMLYTSLSIKPAKGQSIGFAFDKNSFKNFKWEQIPNDDNILVYYLQLNFFESPGHPFIGKDIVDFKDSIPEKSILLNYDQRKSLYELISDSTNFSEGDCGTFHLNAGFILTHNKRIYGTIDIGCGYNQWNFDPVNPISKYGSLNEKGFINMKALLDDINATNKK